MVQQRTSEIGFIVREAVARQKRRQTCVMRKTLFDRLHESVQQADEIIGRGCEPDRALGLNAIDVKEVRAITKLSQAGFAALLQVDVGTLRNWERDRHQPTGPARALLRAIRADPTNVLRALRNAG